jgi:hypothetical protein
LLLLVTVSFKAACSDQRLPCHCVVTCVENAAASGAFAFESLSSTAVPAAGTLQNLAA